MKVLISQDPSQGPTYVEIHCKDVTKEVTRLQTYISNYSAGIKASDGEETILVALSEIFYIESVDKKTFLYTKDRVLATEKRLYELEELLDRRDFFRCSKSVIVNLSKISKLKPEITRNVLATLSNGEVVVISRRYVSDLKKLLGIGG